MGMSFNSEEEAYGFYNEYGRSIGFSIRKHNTTKRKNDGKILCRQLCCSFQGEYHKKRTPTKKRALRRTGCEAMIEVKLEKDDKYHVTKFIEGHNHELVPPSRVHLLRSQRKLQPVQEGLVSNMRASGISPSDIFTYLRTEAGGSQNLNFIRLDSNNFIQRKRTKLLKKGDGKSLLEYFNLKQVENKSVRSRGCINGKDSGDKMIGVKDRRRKKRLSKARKKGVLESNKRDKPESRQDASIGTGCDNIHGDASLDMHLYNTVHLTHPNLGSDRVVNETSVLRPSSSIPPIYGHPYYQIGNVNIIRAEDSNNYSQRFVELLPQRHLGDAATNQNGPTRRLDF